VFSTPRTQLDRINPFAIVVGCAFGFLQCRTVKMVFVNAGCLSPIFKIFQIDGFRYDYDQHEQPGAIVLQETNARMTEMGAYPLFCLSTFLRRLLFFLSKLSIAREPIPDLSGNLGSRWHNKSKICHASNLHRSSNARPTGTSAGYNCR
jgi:hypothetical protein